jgi:hypothetical protein
MEKRDRLEKIFHYQWKRDKYGDLLYEGQTYAQAVELRKCHKKRKVKSCRECLRYETCERRLENNG